MSTLRDAMLAFLVFAVSMAALKLLGLIVAGLWSTMARKHPGEMERRARAAGYESGPA